MKLKIKTKKKNMNNNICYLAQLKILLRIKRYIKYKWDDIEKP